MKCPSAEWSKFETQYSTPYMYNVDSKTLAMTKLLRGFRDVYCARHKKCDAKW